VARQSWIYQLWGGFCKLSWIHLLVYVFGGFCKITSQLLSPISPDNAGRAAAGEQADGASRSNGTRMQADTVEDAALARAGQHRGRRARMSCLARHTTAALGGARRGNELEPHGGIGGAPGHRKLALIMMEWTEREGVAWSDDRDHGGARPEAGKTMLARSIRGAAAQFLCPR
jgi:hypothetical protein